MFLTDAMLLKLGRWLRIMGIDSASPAPEEIDDDVIIYRALREGRILLTMDREMAQNAASTGVRAILIPSRMIEVEEQLTHVLKEAGIGADSIQQRMLCTECGHSVHTVEPEEVRGIVPSRTFAVTSEFWRCDKCGHVYWSGSHWRNIQKTVAKVKACISE